MHPYTQMAGYMGALGVEIHGPIIQRADSFVVLGVHQSEGINYLVVIFQLSLNISDVPLLYKIQSRKRKKYFN